MNTVTGRNLRYIFDTTEHQFDLFTVAPSILKRSTKFCKTNEEDKWRVRILKEITDIKQGVLQLEGEEFSSDELEEQIEFVCIS